MRTRPARWRWTPAGRGRSLWAGRADPFPRVRRGAGRPAPRRPAWWGVSGLALAGPSSAPSPSPPPDCAVCGAPLSGRFCERCGHDSDAPPRATWQAAVRADPAWFEEVCRRNGADAAALEFPRHAVDRCYPLSGERVAIGRHSRSRGATPEIDLADVDPGVSAVHAVLVTRS